MRTYLLGELPGWGEWLTVAAASIQSQAWNDGLLRSEEELLSDLAGFLQEWVEAIGERDAARLFLPFAQKRPEVNLSGDHSAVEPLTDAPTGVIFSHRDLAQLITLKGAVPSRALIGLAGAVGLVCARARRGRPPDTRLESALGWVESDLFPYLKSSVYTGAKAGAPVLPEMYEDGDFNPKNARTRPVSFALLAVVARYVSLPNRTDPDYEYEGSPRKKRLRPDQVDFGTLAGVEASLRKRARALNA